MLLDSVPALTATPMGKLTKAFKLATPVLLATDELPDLIELATDEEAIELNILELEDFTLDELVAATDDADEAAPTIP